MKIPQSTITYPTLRKPLSLVARFLKAGEMLEDLNTTGPTPNFPTVILHTEASEGPKKHLEYISQRPTPSPSPQPPETILLYTDGSKLQNQRCGSAWAIFRQDGELTSPEVSSGQCCIGSKAEVYDAELHAIQEGLLLIHSMNWTPTRILICADNQSALAALAGRNPKNSEFARNTLTTIDLLQKQGWIVSGLWTPAHCGIPGNERADTLAKSGAQNPNICRHARVTRSWLQARTRLQLTVDWSNKHPPEPLFPIRPSTTFPNELKCYSPASLRALFRLQSGTTPSDPYPGTPPERCTCGDDRTSQHLLVECPHLDAARKDLFPAQALRTTPTSRH